MKRVWLITAAVAILGGACAGRPEFGAGEPVEVTFQQLVEDPEEYDARLVTFESGYLSSFEVSALTSGFAESHPPQAIEPTIWVPVSPPADCLQDAEGITWADAVRATGIFRYDPDGGFGHLDAYQRTLLDATLACA